MSTALLFIIIGRPTTAANWLHGSTHIRNRARLLGLLVNKVAGRTRIGSLRLTTTIQPQIPVAKQDSY